MTEKPHSGTRPYDPVEYWSTRSEQTTHASMRYQISKIHKKFMREHIPFDSEILEVGPGIGRLFPMYLGARNNNISIIDLTDQHESTLNKIAGNYGLTVKHNIVSRPDERYPFDDFAFDIGVSSYVFLHVSFNHIDFAITELARVARRCIVFTNYNTQRDPTDIASEQRPDSHVFAHNYDKLLSKHGLKIYDELPLYTDPENARRTFVYGQP